MAQNNINLSKLEKNTRKDVTHRIAFYTGKVADYVSVHPAKKRPKSHTYRPQRLSTYKKAMHKEIERVQEEKRYAQ